MTTQRSDARKRQAECEAAVARHERRREVTKEALECVFFGADFIDADAFLHALADRAARVEVEGT